MKARILYPVAAYFLFIAAPVLALMLTNYLIEPDRVWFTGLSQTQELWTLAAVSAWAAVSLRMFIVPLESEVTS